MNADYKHNKYVSCGKEMKTKALAPFIVFILFTLVACSNSSAADSSVSTTSQSETITPPSSSGSMPSSSTSSNVTSSEPSSPAVSSQGELSQQQPSVPAEPSSTSSSQSEVSQQKPSAATNEEPNPEWAGNYERIIYVNQEYARLGWSYEQSELGEFLGEVTAYGIDSLNSVLHRTTFEAFEIKDVLPEEGVAVKLEIEGEIQYIPFFAQEQSMFTWEGITDFTEQWH